MVALAVLLAGVGAASAAGGGNVLTVRSRWWWWRAVTRPRPTPRPRSRSRRSTRVTGVVARGPRHVGHGKIKPGLRAALQDELAQASAPALALSSRCCGVRRHGARNGHMARDKARLIRTSAGDPAARRRSRRADASESASTGCGRMSDATLLLGDGLQKCTRGVVCRQAFDHCCCTVDQWLVLECELSGTPTASAYPASRRLDATSDLWNWITASLFREGSSACAGTHVFPAHAGGARRRHAAGRA